MVYLIDDKRKRQESDFGWNEKKFQQYKDVLIPIYSIEELLEKAEDIFKSNNSVLYHESFLDNSIYSGAALEKRKRLEEFAANNKEFNLVLFSGSKFNRSLSDNTAHLPVSILYLNLEVYIFQVQEGEKNLNFLLFGNNPKIESELNEKLKKALSEIESAPADIPKQNSLFLRTVKDNIQNPIENCEEKTLFNKDVSDAKFSEYIDEWLDDIDYDNIFVPLCFGPTLSDFNGLRFATHIRCSDTINRTSNVFIYGFVGMDFLLNHECFNILKTKNVKLIQFQKLAFQRAALEVDEVFTKEDFPHELHKLKLSIPQDYDDNHSITNDWAIYKWSYTIPIPVYDKIEKVFEKVENTLYFKYLQTLYPTGEYTPINESNLQILKNCSGKILLIDDNYQKGWLNIFKALFIQNENIELDELKINYRSLSRDQIVEAAKNKIIDNKSKRINYDVVILDFRLHSSDKDELQIDSISGMQILRDIKACNPGIQIIIFSATNKIWNLQSLQKAGADGFIIKEGSEVSIDKDFTRDTILSFIEIIKDSLDRKFLKDLFFKCSLLLDRLKSEFIEEDHQYSFFIKDLISHTQLLKNSAENIDLNDSMTLDVFFLNCYNFLEKFKNYYLKEIDYQLVIGEDEIPMNRYKFNFAERKVECLGEFIRNNSNDNPSWFNCLVGLFIDYFNVCTFRGAEIKKLHSVKDMRNEYIHNNKKYFIKEDVLMVLDLCVAATSSIRE